MSVKIKNIAYALPERLVDNSELQIRHPTWDVLKVAEKSGVYQRYIANETTTALDLGVTAVERLFKDAKLGVNEIQGILFCTQSPDYIMPSNSFLIHQKFNFPPSVWAFDYNLACSGYVYGLSIANGMIATGLAKNVLLITADTYSKYVNKDDRSTTMLFGDGAAATLIGESKGGGIIDVDLGSSGKDYESFYIPAGGCRIPKSEYTSVTSVDQSGNIKSLENIQMNGFAVWKFIAHKIPQQISGLLTRNDLSVSDIDLFIFHQASKMTLDSLVKSLNINENKVYLNIDKVGNTVSASIPIALKYAQEEGRLKRGDKILISGFGVGLSWGSMIIIF